MIGSVAENGTEIGRPGYEPRVVFRREFRFVGGCPDLQEVDLLRTVTLLAVFDTRARGGHLEASTP
jgi:hypothetical protein